MYTYLQEIQIVEYEFALVCIEINLHYEREI